VSGFRCQVSGVGVQVSGLRKGASRKRMHTYVEWIGAGKGSVWRFLPDT
jgi:hypothetical protein